MQTKDRFYYYFTFVGPNDTPYNYRSIYYIYNTYLAVLKKYSLFADT